MRLSPSLLARLLVLPALLLACNSEQPTELTQFATCADLESAVADMARAEFRNDGRPAQTDPMCLGCVTTFAEPMPAGGSRGMLEVTEIDHSQPDFIKNNDQNMFLISGADLVVVQAVPADAMTELARVPIEGNDARLFLLDGVVLVLSAIETGSQTDEALYGNLIKATWVNVSDTTNPRVMRELYAEGSLNSARLVEDEIYLVTSRRLRSAEDVSINGSFGGAPRASELVELAAKWLPKQVDIIDGARTETHLTACTDVYGVANPAGTVMTAMLRLDVDSPLAALQSTALLAPAEVARISDKQIHLGVLEANDGPFADSNGRVNSRIHAFELTKGEAPVYTRSAELHGLIPDSFSIDEQDGLLRAAAAIPDEAGEQHVVYMMDGVERSYTEVGRVEGFATGEFMTTARFDGDQAYVATLLMSEPFTEPNRPDFVFVDPISAIMDPLHTFDLSDPSNPRMLGELEFDGSANYLHPIGDTHLIGVGNTTDDWGSLNGMQVLLFDVQDMSAPTRVDIDEITNDMEWGFTAWDARAVSYYPEQGTLTMPVLQYNWDENTQSSLRIYKPTATGLGFLGTVDTAELSVFTGDPAVDSLCSQARRSIFIGDAVYAVTGGGLKAASANNPNLDLGILRIEDLGACHSVEGSGTWRGDEEDVAP